jgi:hypothetical protein
VHGSNLDRSRQGSGTTIRTAQNMVTAHFFRSQEASCGNAAAGTDTAVLSRVGLPAFFADIRSVASSSGGLSRENSATKMPPVERWEATGFLPRMPDSLEQLDLLLVQVAKARQVRPDGIHFQSLRYISTTLAAYVGETVTLRFDPRDMAEIRSSTTASSCAVPSARNSPVQPFPSERFSVPGISGAASCAASYAIGKAPSIRCWK